MPMLCRSPTVYAMLRSTFVCSAIDSAAKAHVMECAVCCQGTHKNLRGNRGRNEFVDLIVADALDRLVDGVATQAVVEVDAVAELQNARRDPRIETNHGHHFIRRGVAVAQQLFEAWQHLWSGRQMLKPLHDFIECR